MIKYIVVIGVIWAVWFFFIKKKPSNTKFNKEKISDSSDMTKCESCGIYCETDDSILSLGKHYCSDECIKKDL